MLLMTLYHTVGSNETREQLGRHLGTEKMDPRKLIKTTCGSQSCSCNDCGAHQPYNFIKILFMWAGDILAKRGMVSCWGLCSFTQLD